MGAVVLDANVLIGFFDRDDVHHSRATNELAVRLGQGSELLIGASVYAEIQVQPLRDGTAATVDRFVEKSGCEVVAIDRPLAQLAAGLRAEHAALKLGDAFVLALAIDREAELLTFDERLGRVWSRRRREGA